LFTSPQGTTVRAPLKSIPVFKTHVGRIVNLDEIAKKYGVAVDDLVPYLDQLYSGDLSIEEVLLEIKGPGSDGGFIIGGSATSTGSSFVADSSLGTRAPSTLAKDDATARELERDYLLMDESISAHWASHLIDEFEANRKLLPWERKYPLFDFLRNWTSPSQLTFAVGENIPKLSALIVSGDYASSFTMRAWVNRPVGAIARSLKPGVENTMLVHVHGKVGNSFNRAWSGHFASMGDAGLEDILEAVAQSGSTRTHLIFKSCESGVLTEDFMRLQRTRPELTQNVNIYVPIGNYQVLNVREHDDDFAPKAKSPLAAALYGQLKDGFRFGQGIGGKVIVNGKVYDPLKATIQKLKQILESGTLPAVAQKNVEAQLRELKSIRAITQASNRRDLYKALLNWQKLYPDRISLGTKYDMAPRGTETILVEEENKFSFTSHLPENYVLTSSPKMFNARVNKPFPKILISEQVADLVRRTARDMYNGIIEEQAAANATRY